MNDEEARIALIINIVNNAIGSLETASIAARESGLDTTYIVYALDRTRKAKHRLRQLLERDGGVVSLP